jgi:hypothetical protein
VDVTWWQAYGATIKIVAPPIPFSFSNFICRYDRKCANHLVK